MITTLLLVAIISLLFFALKKATERPPGFPPGLMRFPLVGSMPSLMFYERKRDTLPFLARKLGPVFSFYIFNLPTVVISDAKLIREVFKQDAASDRFNAKPFDEIRFGTDGDSRGVLGSNGAEWREQRRFALRKLRDLGFGKSSMNDLVVGEAEKCLKSLSKDVGKSIDLNNRMNLSIVNALWVVMTGEQLSLDDERFKKIVNLFDRALRESGGVEASVAMLGIPWLTKWVDPTYKAFLDSANDIYNLVENVVTEHRKDFDPVNPRDFTDSFLNEIDNCKDASSSFSNTMGMKSLKATFFDLFIAGAETTSSSLVWTFLYLLKFPKIKTKVHEELDRVVGQSRMVTLDDEENLPYVQAVILESMRITSLVPQSIPHVANAEMKIQNYTIPKGTILMGNLIHVHHDETYWKNPKEFNPNRFLSEDGKKVVHDDRLMPFSVGKRFCLGQTLAEKEFFLFFANIMATFDMVKDPNEPLPSTELTDDNVRGIVRSAPAFKLILTNRSK